MSQDAKPLTIDEELKAAQEELAVVEKDRAEAAKIDELKDTKLRIANARALKVLESEHGPVGQNLGVFYVPDGRMVVVKRESQARYDTYKAVLAKHGANTKRVDDMHFVEPCVVYPTKAEFRDLLDQFAGGLDPLVVLCLTLYGHRFQELKKK